MHVLHRRGNPPDNATLTLGDAIAAVSAVVADEREVVAVVLHMLQSRSIRLVGAAPAPIQTHERDSQGPGEQ